MYSGGTQSSIIPTFQYSFEKLRAFVVSRLQQSGSGNASLVPNWEASLSNTYDDQSENKDKDAKYSMNAIGSEIEIEVLKGQHQ